MTYNQAHILFIDHWWAALSWQEHLFWGISIVCSVLFVFQFTLELLGFNATLDTNVSPIAHLPSHFQLVSIHSILAFFTFFAWGATLSLTFGSTLLTALILATIIGLLCMLGMAGIRLLSFRFNNRSVGSLQQLSSAKLANVQKTIPGNKEGKGIVTVSIKKTTYQIAAITEHLTALSTGTKVQVVKILHQDLLLVEPLGR